MTGLTIGIDNVSPGESTAPGAPGGMRSYLGEMLARLPAVAPEARFKLFTPDWNDDFGPLDPRIETIRLGGVPRARSRRVWYQQVGLAAAVNRERLDAFFATATIAPFRVRAPMVLAVQFLQFYDFPESFGRARTTYLKTVVPASIRRASRVVVFTEFHKRELLSHVDYDPAAIVVAPHGVNEHRFAAPATAAAIAEARALAGGRPYVLYVSATYRYKNHFGLIDAFGELKRTTNLPHALVLVGAKEAISADDLMARAARAGVADATIVCGRLPDVAAAYQAADLFVFPSFYETFGLSVVEAMAAGCPVVTSDRGAMAELGREAALLANPEDPAEIAGAMRQVLTDRSRREALIARGRARAATFTWDRSARLTFGALEAAALERHGILAGTSPDGPARSR